MEDGCEMSALSDLQTCISKAVVVVVYGPFRSMGNYKLLSISSREIAGLLIVNPVSSWPA